MIIKTPKIIPSIKVTGENDSFIKFEHLNSEKSEIEVQLYLHDPQKELLLIVKEAPRRHRHVLYNHKKKKKSVCARHPDRLVRDRGNTSDNTSPGIPSQTLTSLSANVNGVSTRIEYLLSCIPMTGSEERPVEVGPRRIMCSHCVSVEKFWLNAGDSHNTRVNGNYDKKLQ